MFDREIGEFMQLLDDAFALNPNWKSLSGTGKALFFKAMQPWSLEAVSQAMTAHIRDPQRGKFQPVPADLIAQIQGANGTSDRPGAEEAWAIAMHAGDESETVVWTQEMCRAYAICSPVLLSGDKIGARMAFKEAYARIVAESIKAGTPVKWEVSLGHDASKRESTVQRAVQLGQLPAPQAHAFLPPPSNPSESSSEGLARLRAEVAKLVPADEKLRQLQEARAAEEREKTATRKRELALMTEQQFAGGCREKAA